MSITLKSHKDNSPGQSDYPPRGHPECRREGRQHQPDTALRERQASQVYE